MTRKDAGRISSDHSAAARGPDPFHGFFQLVMEHRRKHLCADPNHAADLLGLQKLALKSADGDLFRMVELPAFDHRPQHIIAGNIQADGGDIFISGNSLLGRIAPGDDGVIFIGRNVRRILYRHHLDVCIQPLFFRMVLQYIIHDFLQLRIGDDH